MSDLINASDCIAHNRNTRHPSRLSKRTIRLSAKPINLPLGSAGQQQIPQVVIDHSLGRATGPGRGDPNQCELSGPLEQRAPLDAVIEQPCRCLCDSLEGSHQEVVANNVGQKRGARMMGLAHECRAASDRQKQTRRQTNDAREQHATVHSTALNGRSFKACNNPQQAEGLEQQQQQQQSRGLLGALLVQRGSDSDQSQGERQRDHRCLFVQMAIIKRQAHEGPPPSGAAISAHSETVAAAAAATSELRDSLSSFEV